MESKGNIFSNPLEIRKAEQLEDLFEDWKKLIETKSDIVFRDDGKAYRAIEYFNTDGFYPGYFNQKLKTLFIARESRGVSGGDRVRGDLEYLKTASPNSSAYWRRLFYIVEGIRKDGRVKFDNLPYADEILKGMFQRNDFGYAFMNISKYSNDSDTGGTADFELINRFLSDCELEKRNFLREEIEILNPDVIISSNIWGGKIKNSMLNEVFPEKDFTYLKEKSTDKVSAVYDLSFNGKKIKLIDLYHFSAPGSDKDLYYDPVMKALF